MVKREATVARTIPSKPRGKYPSQWAAFYGWRQVVTWTPRVGNHAVMTTIRLLPRFGGFFVGLWAGRDDGDDWQLRVGVGVAEITFDLIEFWPRGQESGGCGSNG